MSNCCFTRGVNMHQHQEWLCGCWRCGEAESEIFNSTWWMLSNKYRKQMMLRRDRNNLTCDGLYLKHWLIWIHHFSSYLAHVKLQTSHVPLNGFDLLQEDRHSANKNWFKAVNNGLYVRTTGYNEAHFARLSLMIIKWMSKVGNNV